MKYGVVDVGGGLRGIYAAGVFDRCLDEGFHFDLCVGVSAGSANTASYLSGQRGRNYRFYCKYTFRKEYMSFRNFLKTGAYLDLGYAYETLSAPDGEDPFAFGPFFASSGEFYAVATDAVTGEARYFTKDDVGLVGMRVFMASSAIPFISHPCGICGANYYDGALGDPVPVDKAFALGCDKVVLVLTRPRDFIRTAEKDSRLAACIQHKYPRAAEKLRLRAAHYNEQVTRAKEYEAEGRLFIVAPDVIGGVDTLTKDKSALRRLYAKGYRDAEAIRAFIKQKRL